ncbi:RELT-like protein 2 [Ambystoma mexicanum]|uniref:RELT-like protein 2 n=1 Tax=Ambystoma mexicanum TaxID=8296 RepID=UPI0037E99756
MAEDSSMENGEAEPQQNPYMLFLLVLVFFFMGLFGFLICHVLKKKGYRCRTSPEELDPETKEALSEDQANEEELSNEDTVERIVKCIIQNEANTEALKQMLGETEKETPAVPSFCPHRNSQDGGPPHHHTVHLGSRLAPCMHCSQKKKHPLQRMGRSKEGRGKPHPGEVTVFSVGRFRVTHIGKKSSLQGSQDETLPDTSNDNSTADKDLSEQSTGKSPTGAPKNGTFQPEESKPREKAPKLCPHNGPRDAAQRNRGAADIRFVDFQAPGSRPARTPGKITKSKATNEPKRRGSAPQQSTRENVVLEMEDIKCSPGLRFAVSAAASSDKEAKERTPGTGETQPQATSPKKSEATSPKMSEATE